MDCPSDMKKKILKELEEKDHRERMDAQKKAIDAFGKLIFMAETSGGVSGKDEELCSAIQDAAQALANLKALQQRQVDAPDWQPSYCETPKGIHTNPDARAWASFFVDTFPQHKHMEDVMHGWFANAMMAMYDNPDTITINREDVPEGLEEAIDKIVRIGGWAVERLCQNEIETTIKAAKLLTGE